MSRSEYIKPFRVIMQKKTEVTEGIRRQASTASCLSNPGATETLR